MDEYKYLLSERELPKSWYNVIPDLPQPLPPPLNPATGQPASPGDLEAIFPHALIAQEVSSERLIPIPEDTITLPSLCMETIAPAASVPSAPSATPR